MGKRLVAVKRMKKRWEGGWDECKKLKELEVSNSAVNFASLSSLNRNAVAAGYPIPS